MYKYIYIYRRSYIVFEAGPGRAPFSHRSQGDWMYNRMQKDLVIETRAKTNKLPKARKKWRSRLTEKGHERSKSPVQHAPRRKRYLPKRMVTAWRIDACRKKARMLLGMTCSKECAGKRGEGGKTNTKETNILELCFPLCIQPGDD